MAEEYDPEEGLAELLFALEEVSGISLGEIMASEFDEPEPRFTEMELSEERAQELEPELDQDYGTDIDDYFDSLFDDINVDVDEDDSYADAEV